MSVTYDYEHGNPSMEYDEDEVLWAEETKIDHLGPKEEEDEGAPAVQEDQDYEADLQKLYEQKKAEHRGPNAPKAFDAKAAAEVVHWLRTVGAGVFAQVIGRLVRDPTHPKRAIATRKLVVDGGTLGAVHLLAKYVGQTYFRQNDWPVTMLSPALSALAIYALRRDRFLSGVAGVSAFFTARWPVDPVAAEGLQEGWLNYYKENVYQGLTEVDETWASGEEATRKIYSNFEDIARSQIASAYDLYDEYVHMAGYRFLPTSEGASENLRLVANKGGTEYWTGNASTNPNGAPLFFRTFAAIDGYAKARGYVAWEAEFDGRQSDLKSVFALVTFFSAKDWNRRWLGATKEGSFDPGKVFERVGMTASGATVGIHPALYALAFHGGNARLDEVLQGGRQT